MAIKRNGKSAVKISTDSDEGEFDSDAQAEFSGHLKALEASFKAARGEMKQLERENERLDAERQRLEMHTSCTTPSSKLSNLEKKVTDLTEQLGNSREETKRLKSKIRRLQTAELKREQRELEEGVGFGEGWTTKYRQMKLLLRRFRDLVEETVLEDPANGEDPDCPICYTAMTTENASSAPCEHIYHTACLMEYSRARGNPFECPECRKSVKIADLQRVQHTAGSQWSELVDVAFEWANIDKDRIEDEPETSDTATEAGFIDDREEGIASWEETNEAGAEGEGSAEPELEEVSGSPQTPSKKRKRHLDALVASRAAKRQKK